MRRRAAIAAVLLCTLAGCRAEPEVRQGFPAACGPSIPENPRPLPATFPRPSGRVLTGEPSRSGQILQVTGFVDRQPDDVVGELAGRPGLEVLAREEERFDAEVTVTDGEHRSIFKLVRACPAGSRFTAVQAPEPGAGG